LSEIQADELSRLALVSAGGVHGGFENLVFFALQVVLQTEFTT